MGEHVSLRPGQTGEKWDARPYSPGDDLRYVNWKLSARRQKLWLYANRENPSHFIYAGFDGSASLRSVEGKEQAGKTIHASLVYLFKNQRDKVEDRESGDFLPFALSLKPGRRFRHAFWTGDLYIEKEAFRSACKSLAQKKIILHFIHIEKKSEHKLPATNTWRDSETGLLLRRMNVSGEEIYEKGIRERRAILASYGHQYLPVDADNPVEVFLYRITGVSR